VGFEAGGFSRVRGLDIDGLTRFQMSKAIADVLITFIYSSQSFWLVRTTAVVFSAIMNRCIGLGADAQRVADAARAYNCYRNKC
jgi:hypothetical protein